MLTSSTKQSVTKVIALPILLCAVILNSCGDAVITDDYIAQNIISSLLIVNDTVKGVKVFKSQPLNKPYDITGSMIKDASVALIEQPGNIRIPLTFRIIDSLGNGEYYSADGVKVKRNTTYNLEVKFADGSSASGTTTTPDSVYWERTPSAIAQFPIDTLRQPSTDTLFWNTKSTSQFEYLLSITTLDTLEYGKYLNPPTQEKNRRTSSLINRFANPSTNDYFEQTNWAFLVNNNTPYVWAVFKWFGKHKIVLYAPDVNMSKWFKLNQFQGNEKNYDPNQGSIKGNAIGVCGSASVTSAEVFVLKNQP